MAKQVARTEVNTVRTQLEAMKGQLEMALPKHLPVDRLLRIAMTAIQVNPKLLECERQSLFASVMTAAQLGLEPDGILGQAYLVPMAGRAQLWIGYKGLLTLARNSGQVSSIMAQAVHENDEFEFAFGLHEELRHVPARGDRGEITYFWAMAKFTDGGHHWDVMSREEVEAIRNGSAGYQASLRFNKEGPWQTHFEEMGRKTAIRRIAKYLPLDVQRAAAIAAAYDTGQPTELTEGGDLKVIDAETGEVSEETQPAGTDALDAFAADAKIQGGETASASATATATVLTASPPDAGPRDEELHASSAAVQGGDGQQQPLTQDEFDRLLNRMRSMAREQAEVWKESPRVKGSLKRMTEAQEETFTEELQKLPWAAEQEG